MFAQYIKRCIFVKNKKHLIVEKLKEIKVSRNDIRSTDAFKKSSPMRQKFCLHGNNVRAIQHSVNVATNIGFEKWDQQTNSTFTNREIVKELIKKEL